jgi:hypothetical protein
MGSGGMIYSYIQTFMKFGRGVQAILRFHLRNLRSYNIGVTEGRGLMNYAVEMSSVAMMYISSFIKIGLGIESC